MILVTGGTGAVGSEVVKAVASYRVPQRVVVRNPAKAEGLKAFGAVEVVRGDFGEPDSMESAMRGADVAFLLPPVEPGMVAVQEAFIDAAKRVGVRRIVKLSAVGARRGAPHRFGDWHGRGEEYLKKSGLEWTILRPNFFMQNLLGLVGMAKEGTIYAPAGDGKAAFVDVRDIAAVAGAALTEEGHAGKVYEVTGPEAIGYEEIAAAFAEAIGRPVKYMDVPAAVAKGSMTRGGMPEWLADAINELNAEMKAGHFATVTNVVRDVGMKEPVTMKEFLRDNVRLQSGRSSN